MSELTVANLFDKAYDATRAGIKLDGFAAGAPWNGLVPKLRETLGDTFNADAHRSMHRLREAMREAAEKTGASEGDFLAAGASVAVADGGLAGNDEVRRAAAIKLMRHTYYHAQRDNQKMWIVSLPDAFDQWPHKYLVGTRSQLVTKLGMGDERFSREDRRKMSEATQRGLTWTLKALIVLGDVTDGSRGLRLLKRWFAQKETTADELRNFAKDTLTEGLKKIANKMQAGTMIVTDFVPIRNSNAESDQKAARSNAFVTIDARDVIYIEKPFFSHSATSVFQKDERHWARIMVHEMSHREVKTKDHRYGWAGIKPDKETLTSAQAMDNADSWALFVANAAGAMSKIDIARAQKGTRG